MAVVSEKKRFFLKKVNKLFASSDFVATFASAFEKNAPSYSDEEFSIREFELKRGLFFGKKQGFHKPKAARNFPGCARRELKTESFLENVCRIEKDVLSL